MSRKNPQEYTLLGLAKFNEYCSVLAIKELSCYDPDKKTIEKAFRKRALKTHPDKGGDPVEFKKINDAYNRLIGHILKLEQQSEENELANSILIEVSKASIPKWIEKLKRCYGWPKSDDCKCIIFEGAYKQFKGRSKNTGPITLVLYEDPPDNIPKIHIRSLKYMAWIAEQMMPVHMHVEKGRSIQFDQWRIAHVAEFGICAFKTPTPAPQRKQPEPKDPKPKRKARDASEPAPKARRDSEPAPEPAKEPENKPGKECTEEAAKAPESEIKTAKESDTKNLFQSEVFKMATDPETFNPEEWEEVSETSDPFPKLYNMADQSFTKNGKKYRRKERGEPPKPEVKMSQFNCGHCGINFSNLVEYTRHKMSCVPDKDFGLTGDIMDSYGEYLKNKLPTDKTKMDCEEKEPPAKTEKVEEVEVSDLKFDFLTGDSVKARKKSPEEPSYTCGNCDAGFEKLKEYTNHKISCKESSSMVNKLNDNHVPQNNLKPVPNNFEAPKEKDKKLKTTEEQSENKENSNLNNIDTEFPLGKEEENMKEKISQDISSIDSKVLTKPPKIQKPKKDLKDSQPEDGKPNASKEQRKLVYKSEIDDKSKVEVGKGNIQMESLRESLPPASKTPELEAKLNLEDPREEKKVNQNKSKNDPGEIKHSKTEKLKKSEEVEKEDLPIKPSSTKKENIKGVNMNGIQPAEQVVLDKTIKIKHAKAENSDSLTPLAEADVTKMNISNTVKKMAEHKDVHSMPSKIKTESEKTTPLQNKTIDGLDNEAIRLSNEIFSFSNNEEEKCNVKDISINTKPKHTYVKTSSKSLADPLSHGPLDLEAIRLSNEIFSDNTKMSLEELQMNESFLQHCKQSSSKADSTKAEKEVKTMIDKKAESPEMMKHVQHARQCFVVNKPIQDEKASVFDASLKKSSSDAEIKPHVKHDDKDLNKYISVSKYKSSEYKNDVHKNRPLFLGLSRFDDPDNFKLSPSPSIPNLKTAGNHELQRPVRNATFADLSMSKSDSPDLHSLTTSSSFAFESSKSVSPKHTRKTFDRNFNASPSPFTGGKYSVHFSEPQTLSKTSSQLGSSLTWGKHSAGSISNNHSSLSASSLVNSSNQPTHSKYQNYPSSTKHSKGELRAKSEGSSTGQTYSVTKPSNNMSADLLRQIQVTKEKHRENCEKALSFEKPQFKPPIYKDKLPRPGNDYARYSTVEREKLARRQEREKTVINKVLAERAGRATSLENKYRI